MNNTLFVVLLAGAAVASGAASEAGSCTGRSSVDQGQVLLQSAAQLSGRMNPAKVQVAVDGSEGVEAARPNASLSLEGGAANTSANNSIPGHLIVPAVTTGGVFNSANESGVYFTVLIAVSYILVAYAAQRESTSDVQRVEGWTGFRWFLALWIFLEHHQVHPITGSGSFLLLSGAMLAMSRRDVASVSGYLAFLVRRLARIFPAYWLAISAFLSIRGGMPLPIALLRLPVDHPGLFLALQPWMESSKDNRLWFIGCVVQLYLLFPLLSLLLSRLGTRRSASRCLVVAGVCYAAQWLIALYSLWAGYQHKSFATPILGVHVKPYANPLTRLPQFVMGMSLGHLLQAASSEKLQWGGLVPSRLTDSATVATMVLAVIGRLIDCQSHPASAAFNDFFLFSPVVYILLVGIALGTHPSVTSQVLTCAHVRVLGKWSYGIYLWNMFIVISHSWWSHDSSWGIVADYAFCVVMSAISFLLVEEPSQRLADRLLNRK